MARELNRLTALEVRNAQPEDNAKGPKLLTDGGGLYLQITPQGSKSFLFRYTFGSKPQVLGMGATHTIGLAAARLLAQSYRAMVLNGEDPKVAREREKTAKNLMERKTFQWCAEQYIETHKDGWKNAKHAHQWQQTLEDYAFPKMGALPVRDIDAHHLMAVLKPIWETKNETAMRLRGRIERILGWAAINQYRSGENPARWHAYLSELLPNPRRAARIQHHPAIKHTEIADFLVKLKAQSESVGAKALEFLVLTAARTGEVIGAEWTEFDCPNKVWTVPATRMKSGRPHAVPLSPRALAIVESIKHLPDEKFVFRGVKHGTAISNMAMLQIMRRMKLEEVPHGMRSTFRDWAADMTEFPKEVAEAALAHVIGDQTEAAYLRSDRLARRRVMMDAWAAYCSLSPATAKS